ncbi:electron transfer flavoprotein subunit beta/FixA family protein [Desulfobulbus alkaliphilus]|uniref:electron transfer flavoprotein subunit beta/FixA family protein n=1 Tax=Desulfobulbus alkaliphilus TaxID=869814 RepID=UPI001963B132|nr:electron transfer flavoprotein subunit beta/FixA family protein [Desulfobulbus alkaliphilus]MBM9535956.1 electron transfer flavoprotein subunit beta/FixA family protein [Desulfobulbus alkaliphilus]
MNILICIKQVPDMESKFKVNAQGNWYDRADLAWRMNEYDEYAVEQAVRLKEQVGEADLTVLCVGPDQVKETMKKALAMGCDRGVHIADNDSCMREPFAIATMIADFARDKQFDIIFTGMQSQDRGSAQVGVMIAELLNISAVTTIVEFAYDNGTISVKRELEGGSKALVTVTAPVVLTCQLGLNTPRYPTLPNIMKAKKKEMLTIAAATDEQGRQETAAFYFPQRKGGGLVLEGDPPELADKLIQLLKEKTGALA